MSRVFRHREILDPRFCSVYLSARFKTALLCKFNIDNKVWSLKHIRTPARSFLLGTPQYVYFLLTLLRHSYAIGFGFDSRTDSCSSNPNVRWTSFDPVPITYILPRPRRCTHPPRGYYNNSNPSRPGIRTSMGPNITVETESPSSTCPPLSRTTKPWVAITHYASQPRHVPERISVWI